MDRQIGMDAVSNHIPENRWPARSTVHRPVCEQAIITTSSVRELETRPSGSGHRCLHTGLKLPSREIVCEPTLGSYRQSPVTHSHARSSGAGAGSTSLEGPSMVSSTPSNAGQSTNSHPSVTRDNASSTSEQSARHHPTVSCIRQQCEGSHLSQTATDLVLSSWRDKSTKSYNSSFKWARWCSERDRDPLSGPISDVANFLAELFEQGYHYSSLNMLIAQPFPQLTRELMASQWGNIPQLLGKRPPLPKYSTTWEVSKVTSYITTLGDNHSLSLKSLSLN